MPPLLRRRNTFRRARAVDSGDRSFCTCATDHSQGKQVFRPGGNTTGNLFLHGYARCPTRTVVENSDDERFVDENEIGAPRCARAVGYLRSSRCRRVPEQRRSWVGFTSARSYYASPSISCPAGETPAGTAAETVALHFTARHPLLPGLTHQLCRSRAS